MAPRCCAPIDIVKSFGDRVVLDGISLALDAHEVVALIGPSGSGKSTLLRCLNLLERIDDGQILLGDEDISDPRVKVDAVRARFGVVFQHYNLFPHLTVLDNVTLALRRVHGMSRAGRRRTRARRCWNASASRSTRARIPIASRAVSSSAPPSCARSRAIPRCCCSTRSPAPSTRSSSARCSSWSASWARTAPRS